MLHFAKGIVAKRKGFKVNWAKFATKAQWWGGRSVGQKKIQKLMMERSPLRVPFTIEVPKTKDEDADEEREEMVPHMM